MPTPTTLSVRYLAFLLALLFILTCCGDDLPDEPEADPQPVRKSAKKVDAKAPPRAKAPDKDKEPDKDKKPDPDEDKEPDKENNPNKVKKPEKDSGVAVGTATLRGRRRDAKAVVVAAAVRDGVVKACPKFLSSQTGNHLREGLVDTVISATDGVVTHEVRKQTYDKAKREYLAEVQVKVDLARFKAEWKRIESIARSLLPAIKVDATALRGVGDSAKSLQGMIASLMLRHGPLRHPDSLAKVLAAKRLRWEFRLRGEMKDGKKVQVSETEFKTITVATIDYSITEHLDGKQAHHSTDYRKLVATGRLAALLELADGWARFMAQSVKSAQADILGGPIKLRLLTHEEDRFEAERFTLRWLETQPGIIGVGTQAKGFFPVFTALGPAKVGQLLDGAEIPIYSRKATLTLQEAKDSERTITVKVVVTGER